MTSRSACRLAGAVFAALLAAGPRGATAQTASQLGAWDALTISPIGALAPVARDPVDMAPGGNALSLRYGRWRYDADDAVHDNFGLTWTHGLGFWRAQVAVTGLYELVECPTCSGWVMGGIDLQSTLVSHAFAGESGRPVMAGAALRLSVGGAHYLGAEATATVSAALTLPIDFDFPMWRSSSLCLSVLPGFGFGRIAGTDLAENGALPMIGAAVAWTISSRVGIDLGLQRIIISGGPTLIGAAFTLSLGSKRDVRP